MGKATSGKSRKQSGGGVKHPKLKTEAGIDQPTPEQAARGHFALLPVTTEMGQVVGRAYRRQPLYLSMAKQMKIVREQLDALNFYRASFDRSERSATKSCLAVGNGGGRGEVSGIPVDYTPAIAEARRKLGLCERPLGALLSTMRAVVLEDQSFSEIAVARYGSRKRDWIDVDVPVMKDGKPLKVTLGFVVTIEQYAPFRVGRNTVGQPLGGQDWSFAWKITIVSGATSADHAAFRVGQNRTGDPLASTSTAVAALECEIRRIAPAHTVLSFSF